MLRRTQRARKAHRCFHCKGEIAPGTVYDRIAIPPNDKVYFLGATGWTVAAFHIVCPDVAV